MNQLALKHSRRVGSARDALLNLLGDREWHGWEQLKQAAGVRYGARLCELRDDGYEIASEELELGKRYRLASLKPGPKRAHRVKVYLDENDAASVTGGYPTRNAREAIRHALESFRSNKVRT